VVNVVIYKNYLLSPHTHKYTLQDFEPYLSVMTFQFLIESLCNFAIRMGSVGTQAVTCVLSNLDSVRKFDRYVV
jgi:hypothetical protein